MVQNNTKKYVLETDQTNPSQNLDIMQNQKYATIFNTYKNESNEDLSALQDRFCKTGTEGINVINNMFLILFHNKIKYTTYILNYYLIYYEY